MGIDALDHFLKHGVNEGRDPNPYFDTKWYLSRYPDIEEAGLNPLVHFALYGGQEGRSPGPEFDCAFYLQKYEDVRLAGINPLSHFLTIGRAEGREPSPRARAAELVGAPLPPYEAWLAMNRLSAQDITELKWELEASRGSLPKISLITPVYNTDPVLFREMIDSVIAQIYGNWELCIVDDASPAGHVSAMLEEAQQLDPRIKVMRLSENGGISVATNAAVEMASGDFVAFLDHDDLITPDCLAHFALLIGDEPEIDMAYSDDDKIDLHGLRYAPQFKPDWSPVLLLTFMYISHMLLVRKSIFQELGGFRKDFDGSQDYDFALRAAEVVGKVGHIPRILYHWRAVEGSTALSAEGKPQSIEAGRVAVEQALHRRGFTAAQVIHPDWAKAAKVGMFQSIFPDDGPSVCLIIPTKNGLDLLERCVSSLNKTSYKNFEVMIVDNDSDDPATLSFLSRVHGTGNIIVERISNDGGKFSYARVNNEAVRRAVSDYVLFLNNDTEVIEHGWLSQMMGYAQMPGIGAVGAKLYFEDGTIQHAGITHGHNEGLAGHAFRGSPPYDWGYLGLIRSSRECMGVTAACMLTPRETFIALGGFDEKQFAVSYNDADYCYRLVADGLRCIYCASAELYHYEGKTRGFNEDPRERLNYRLRYSDLVDPWYNPNLSLEDESYTPAAIRPVSRSKTAVRVVGVTHNLNNEGAPTTFLDLFIGMKRAGLVEPLIISPVDGPLRAFYEAEGIKVIVTHSLFHGVKDRDTMEAGLGGLAMLFRALNAEVVVANTLQTFWGVRGARQAKLPALWCQHESEDWATYFDFLSEDMRASAYQGFSYAYRVLYVADATRRAWRVLETRGNFELIRHGIPPERLKAETERWSREQVRTALEIPEDQLCLSVVGTVCRRKGQIDLVQAAAMLPDAMRRRTTVFIAGHIAEPDYAREITEATRNAPGLRVVLTGRMEDPFVYYRLADIAVCTSRFESAPRVLVEAMACGLPIITTPVFGIPEMVRSEVNAFFYEPGDTTTLAAAIERLWSDNELRTRFAENSPLVLASQPGFPEMVKRYGEVIREAVNLP
jgi:GT2 family glycosyltransferase